MDTFSNIRKAKDQHFFCTVGSFSGHNVNVSPRTFQLQSSFFLMKAENNSRLVLQALCDCQQMNL